MIADTIYFLFCEFADGMQNEVKPREKRLLQGTPKI